MPDIPARHFNLQGASNFRDLGGYATRDGRIVRWRQIFRSNHLGHLTAADIEIVRALGVKSAFDFRGLEERAGAACGLEEITVHSLPIEPTVMRRCAQSSPRGPSPLRTHWTSCASPTAIMCASTPTASAHCLYTFWAIMRRW